MTVRIPTGIERRSERRFVSSAWVGQSCSLFAGYLLGKQKANEVANEAAADHKDHERPEALGIDTDQLTNSKTC